MKETLKKYYLMIMNNRQIVGKWAKTNMVRIAMAAMVAAGVGMSTGMVEASVHGNDYTGAIIFSAEGNTTGEGGDRTTTIDFTSKILTLHQDGTGMGTKWTGYYVGAKSYVKQDDGSYNIVYYSDSSLKNVAGTVTGLDATSAKNMLAAVNGDVSSNYRYLEISTSKADSSFATGITQNVFNDISVEITSGNVKNLKVTTVGSDDTKRFVLDAKDVVLSTGTDKNTIYLKQGETERGTIKIGTGLKLEGSGDAFTLSSTVKDYEAGAAISITGDKNTIAVKYDGTSVKLDGNGALSVNVAGIKDQVADVTRLNEVSGAVAEGDTSSIAVSVKTLENNTPVTKTGTIDLSTLTTDQGDTNTTNITKNTTDITNLTTRVSNNETNISKNTTDITNLTTRVSNNETNISKNTTDITNLTTKVTNNENNITKNTTNINTLMAGYNGDDYITVTNPTMGADGTVTAGKITFTPENLEKIKEAVDTTYEAGAAISITGDKNTIAVKYDGTSVKLDGNGALSVNVAGIKDQVADVTRLNEVSGAVAEGDTSSIAVSVKTLENNTPVTKTGTIDLSTLTTDQGDTNTTNITKNTTDITNLTTRVSNNETNISKNTTDITNLTTRVSNNETNISKNTTDITNLTTRVSNNETNISKNTTDITNLTTRVSNNETNIAKNTTNINTLMAGYNGDDYITVTNPIMGADGTVTAGKITFSPENLEKIKEAVDTTYEAGAAISITGDKNTIAVKYDGTSVKLDSNGALAVDIEKIKGQITDVTRLNEVSGAVAEGDTSSIAVSVKTLENNTPVTKTGTIDLSTLTTDQGDTNTTNITKNTTDITNLTTRVSNNETNIAKNTTDITNLTTRVSNNETNISKNTTDITNLTTRVSNNETNITKNTTDITNLTTRVSNNETNISKNTTDITNLTTRVSNNETNIAKNTTNINTLMAGYDGDDYITVTNPVKAADGTVTAGKITFTPENLEKIKEAVDTTYSAGVATLITGDKNSINVLVDNYSIKVNDKNQLYVDPTEFESIVSYVTDAELDNTGKLTLNQMNAGSVEVDLKTLVTNQSKSNAEAINVLQKGYAGDAFINVTNPSETGAGNVKLDTVAVANAVADKDTIKVTNDGKLYVDTDAIKTAVNTNTTYKAADNTVIIEQPDDPNGVGTVKVNTEVIATKQYVTNEIAKISAGVVDGISVETVKEVDNGVEKKIQVKNGTTVLAETTFVDQDTHNSVKSLTLGSDQKTLTITNADGDKASADLSKLITEQGNENAQNISNLETKVENYNTETTKKITNLDTKVEKYNTDTNVRIDNLDTKVENYKNVTEKNINNLYNNDQILEQKIENINNNTNQRFGQMNSKIEKVGAHAAALAGIHYQPMRPGESQIGAGVGHYKGKSAMALGGAYQVNNRVMVQISGSVGSGEYMANLGASYKFGQHTIREDIVENPETKAISLEQAETIAVCKSLDYKNQVQAEEIAKLKADKAAQDERIAKLEALVAQLAAKK